MNETPRGSRLHIAIFGRRNAGKSSLINALTNQDVAIVSDIPGTTTDPVFKSMEILPVGPVVIIDTAGIDDAGALGELRVQKTIEVFNKTDLIVMVIDPAMGIDSFETDLLIRARKNNIPVVGALNKIDILPGVNYSSYAERLDIPVVPVSARTKQGLEALKQEIIKCAPKEWTSPTILGDLINPEETVILVIPIDKAAPKGRLILPQMQTLRDILDNKAVAVVTRESELADALEGLKADPSLVVTDSQAFKQAAAIIPTHIRLTSFSVLFARYKGDLDLLVVGAKSVEALKPGDQVLIAEACTHHRVEDDIGTVKIPNLLRKRVGGDLEFSWSSGTTLPDNLEQFKLIIHCGACMINRKEMLHRIMVARQAKVPIVNYGVLIAYMHGILPRVLTPFPRALEILQSNQDGINNHLTSR